LFSIACVAAVLLASACSGDESTDATSQPQEASPTAERERPPGPAADLSEELTGGNGVMLSDGDVSSRLADAGFVQREYVAAGTATSYVAPAGLPADGRFELQEDGSADYRTRVAVRMPASADDFNGTVVVEWLNVSARG
jgi:hypothetical protein